MEVPTEVLPVTTTVLDRELRLVIYLQKKLSPWYDYPAIFMHYLFREDILMLLGPISTFLFNYYTGIILRITFVLVEIIAGIFKWCCRLPRPFWVESTGALSNRMGEWEQDYGFPSSHSGLIASWTMLILLVYIDIKYDPQFMADYDITENRNILIIFFGIGVVLSLVTGLSRIYFAVHYLRDVIVGYFLGVLVAVLTYYLIKITRAINEWGSIAVAISLTGMSIVLMIVTRPLCPQDRAQMPTWEANALKTWNARKGENITKHPVGIHPRSISRYICAFGILFGTWIGDPLFRLLHNGEHYHECQKWTKTKGIRFGIGMSGVFLFLIIIYVIIPKISRRRPFLYTSRAIFSTLYGLWFTLISQLIFYSAGFNKC